MSGEQTPDMGQVIAAFVEDGLSRVWTALPGRVVSFDHETQRASVFPLVQNIHYDENEERVAERLPVIPDVPVMFQGCGAYRITFPVSKGDLGLLVFTSCSLDRWLAGDGREVDPGDDRRNNLSDAVFLPGLYSFGRSPTSAPSNAMVMHADSLLLGGPDASDPVVRRSDLDAVVSRLESHTHPPGEDMEAGGNAVTGDTGEPNGSFSTPACSPVVRSK
jgi:hypothetical protein